MNGVKFLILGFLAVFMQGCSSKQVKSATDMAWAIGKKDSRVAAVTTKYARYIKIAEKLKKYHDSGTLDERDVLDVLEAGGVKSRVPVKTGAKTPTKNAKATKDVAKVPAPVQDYRGTYRWPLDDGIVSSEFGARWGKQHEGIDIAADMGEPVKAVADGVVMYSAATMRGYGNALIVRHDEQVTTLYAHNKALLAKSGDKVTQGQVIALLGSTGRSTGPHIHFEIREGHQAMNPRHKLARAHF